MSWRGPRAITVAGIVAVTAIFAWLVWERRWMSDDGLIVVRVARQIAHGNGPVYTTLERVEPATNALWTWLLAGVAVITEDHVAEAALWLGGLCAIGALVLGFDASRRWHRARGCSDALVPCAAVVVIGVFPFWDFATAGLENGLALLWLAASWWLLVMARPRTMAFVFGLGPLVRPDLALASAVFLVAGWLALRPARRQALWLLTS